MVLAPDVNDEALTSFGGADQAFNRLTLEVKLGSRTEEVVGELARRLSDAGQALSDTQVEVARAATAATLTLSAGFAAWTLRSGALLASLFASSPLWRQFDPLPVLGSDDDGDEGAYIAGDGEDLFGGDGQIS